MSGARLLVLDLRDRRPAWSIPAWAVDEIRDALPDGWEMASVETAADGRGDGSGASPEAQRAIRGAEVYLGFGVSRDLFRAATGDPSVRLRWVHSGSAGVGGSLFPEMRASRVVLTNSAGIYADPIAESVFAAILHFARGIDLAVRARAERRWAAEAWETAPPPVWEVAGTTLGIVGLGGIGRAVAERAGALGMRVVALRRSGREAPPGVELLAGPDALDHLLERSQALVLALPATERTRGMIGAAELARLPPDAVLVNIARGSVLDEEALVDALRRGALRGAALDVFATEPLPAASPLWGLSNVLITPHVSGTSRRFWRRQTDLIVDNLRRYLSGRSLRNVVDKEAGY